MPSKSNLTPERRKQLIIDNIARKQRKAATLRDHLRKSMDRTKEKTDGI